MIQHGVLANLFFYFLLLSSGPVTNVSEKPKTQLIHQIYIDSELYAEYTYTDENRISEEKTRYLYIKYKYNDKNQIISSVTCEDPSLVSSNLAIAEAAKLRKEWITPASSENTRQKTFEYNAKGQVVKILEQSGNSIFKYDSKNRITTQVFYRDKKICRHIDYTYDKHGNVIKMSNYEVDAQGNQLLATTHEYEFDSKNNPFRSLGITMMPGKYTNPNNITQEVYTLHLMENQRQVTQYSYEYDGEGYPVSVNKNMKYIYY
jgi:hypothetical protein